MFGIPSLTKLLVLIAIIMVVWYGFKLIGQIDRARKEAQRLHRAQRRSRSVEQRGVAMTQGVPRHSRQI